MNVAGAILDRLYQDQVGQLDHRGFFARSRQLIQIHLFDGFARDDDVVGIGCLRLPFFSGILNDVLHAAAFGRIDIIQLVDDCSFSGDQRGNLQFRDALDIIDGQDI